MNNKIHIAVLYNTIPPDCIGTDEIEYHLVKVKKDNQIKRDIVMDYLYKYCGMRFDGLIVDGELRDSYAHTWLMSRVRPRWQSK